MPPDALRAAFDLIEPYRGLPHFGRAWDAIGRAYRDHGASAAREAAEAIADTYEDIVAEREVRALERAG